MSLTNDKFNTAVAQNGSSVRIYGFRVDGKILVDTGLGFLGDSKVSTTSPKQGEGTISAINGSVVSIDPFVDNCFVAGQYLIHTTPKPIKITPKTEVITDVNSSGDVLTFAGNDELIEFADGDPVTRCDSEGNPVSALVETSNYGPDIRQPTEIGWSSNNG